MRCGGRSRANLLFEGSGANTHAIAVYFAGHAGLSLEIETQKRIGNKTSSRDSRIWEGNFARFLLRPTSFFLSTWRLARIREKCGLGSSSIMTDSIGRRAAWVYRRPSRTREVAMSDKALEYGKEAGRAVRCGR